MKRILMLIAILLSTLTTTFAFVGCEKKQSFPTDGLEEIKPYVLEYRNYTVKINYYQSEKIYTCYVTDSFVAKPYADDLKVGVAYLPDQRQYVWSSYGHGYGFGQLSSNTNIYDSYGCARFFKYEWVYNEDEMQYVYGKHTLQIKGGEVIITLGEEFDGNKAGEVYTYYDFGITEFTVPGLAARLQK